MLVKNLLKLLVFIVVLIPASAFSQSGERIHSFDSQVKVTKKNVVEVTETIVYDFLDQDRHGIFRYVPIEYTDEKSQKYYVAVNFIGATDAQGKVIPAGTSRSKGNYIIRLGDPDKTVRGVNTYKISYTLSPVVRQEGDRGFLALDITGGGWDVLIQRVSATLSFEDGVVLGDAKCFAGASGSTQGCAVQQEAPQTYTAQNLLPGQGLTVQGFLPAGYVSNYLTAGQKPPLTLEDFLALVFPALLVLGVLVGAVILFLRWYRECNRKSAQTIIAQYEPPDGLSPGEVGLLQDDVSDIRETTAILIDLAVRGYMKIEQTSPRKWFRNAQYTLHKLKDSIDLTGYEQKLFKAIFSKGANSVKIDNLDKYKVSAAISSMNSELKDGLKKKGFYGSLSSEPGVIEKLLDAGNISEAGAVEWAKVEGLKLYLNVAEKDRLNFTDAPERTPELFNKLLPYAVALGVEKQWAKQFSGIDVMPATSWYVGSYPQFSPSALASDLGANFSSSFGANSTVSSTSAGGGSGSGFGGGGGGSW